MQESGAAGEVVFFEQSEELLKENRELRGTLIRQVASLRGTLGIIAVTCAEARRLRQSSGKTRVFRLTPTMATELKHSR